MKKNFVLGLLVLCSICFSNEQKTVIAKPGAILELYDATTQKVRPDIEDEPIAVVVDKGSQFTHCNIIQNKEVARYRDQYLFKIWRGYVTIPADGNYVIALSYNYYDKWGTRGPNNSHTILEISGKTIMAIAQGQRSVGAMLDGRGSAGKLNATQNIRLQKGSYEFKIIHRSGVKNDVFTLKLWDKKRPLKKIFITPANMAHVE